ncbi:hypothetical protein [Persicitalea jodogahamensis]|uniref:Uncharacterized protein n=1 Tax=Persicitalea jodogahamensis TaxID=402147 RepID=A0A8J3D8D8_9BACT|nr:hypothetical protein [Persicitalea jodogahamensis]GHB88983.1 hypothetical protein GCM10007390_51400 [Persicitalea jodogahamensis]
MKNKPAFAPPLLTWAFALSLLLLHSCHHPDVPPQAIDPSTQPTQLTGALKTGGKLKSGGLLAGVKDGSLLVEKSQPSASVTSDNSLFIPFVYGIDPAYKLRGFYLQVRGSDNYWDIPYRAANARTDGTNANPERNGFVLDIGIPAHILTGKFELIYQIYDDKGRVSQPITMSVEIVSAVDYCNAGGTSLGSVSGQDGITVRSYELGDKPGWVTIGYDTYTVKDRIDIRYAGEWIASTGKLLAPNQVPPIGRCGTVTAADGFVGKRDSFRVFYDPKKGKRLDIYVSGCLDGGTQWVFALDGCPVL